MVIRFMGFVRAPAWRKGPRRLLLASSAMVCFAAAATAAQAADAAAPAAPSGGPELDTVIVTARKRSENAQNIPVSVSALSAQQLERYSIKTVEEIAASTPQFIVVRGSSGSGQNLSLRGIGSNFTSIGIEQSVAVIVDGVYYGQGRILNEAMFDMKQVEVLKGPQSLFFGKNSTAGVVSFTTNDPSNAFEAAVKGGYEFTTREASVEGSVSGPVTDQLGLRLALRYTDMSGGLMKNQGLAGALTTQDIGAGNARTVYNLPAPSRWGPASTGLTGRFTAKYTPTSDLEVTLKGSASRQRSTGPQWDNELFSCASGSSQLKPGNECHGDWKTYWEDLPSGLVSANPHLNGHGGQLYDDYNSHTGTATVAYSTPLVNFTWVNGVESFHDQFMLKSDATDNVDRGTYAATDTKYTAYSTELRAQTKLEGPLNLMAGLYYQTSKLNFLQDVIFPGTAATGHNIDSSVSDPALRMLSLRKIGRTDGSTFAIFGQAIWKITPELEATVGARYTREPKDSTFSQPYVQTGLRAVFVGGARVSGTYVQFDPVNPGGTGFTKHQAWDNVSPEATLTWRPTSDVTAYVAYKTGYKSGGFSISALNTFATTVGNLAFEPETAKGWEAGVKSTVLDGRLRANFSVYSYRYNDLQVDFFNSTIPAFVTFNAGAAQTRGAELALEWAPPIHGLILNGTVAYDRAKYVSFPGAPCYAGQTPAMGCLAPTPQINYVHQDLAGVPTQLAPKWTLSGSADYKHEVGSNLELGVSVAARYSDGYLLSPFGNRRDYQKSYANLDASLYLAGEESRWRLSLIGKNLTDQYVLTAAQDAPSTGSGTGTAAGVAADQYGFPAPRRTVALQLSLRY